MVFWRNPTQHCCGGQLREEGQSEQESSVREEEETKKVPQHHS